MGLSVVRGAVRRLETILEIGAFLKNVHEHTLEKENYVIIPKRNSSLLSTVNIYEIKQNPVF